MSKVIEYLDTLLIEKKMWSKKVETSWKPKEGFFEQSADKIASGLKKASKDLKQAMSRLNFYVNRAGKNLSSKDKSRLENAKDKLKKLFESTITEGARSKLTDTRKPTPKEKKDGAEIVFEREKDGKEYTILAAKSYESWEQWGAPKDILADNVNTVEKWRKSLNN